MILLLLACADDPAPIADRAPAPILHIVSVDAAVATPPVRPPLSPVNLDPGAGLLPGGPPPWDPEAAEARLNLLLEPCGGSVADVLTEYPYALVSLPADGSCVSAFATSGGEVADLGAPATFSASGPSCPTTQGTADCADTAGVPHPFAETNVKAWHDKGRKGMGLTTVMIDTALYTIDTTRKTSDPFGMELKRASCFTTRNQPTTAFSQECSCTYDAAGLSRCPRFLPVDGSVAIPALTTDAATGQHGTHMASIALGSSATCATTGVAPAANLWFIRVGRKDGTVVGANLWDILRALNAVKAWAVVGSNATQIAAVNLSMNATSTNPSEAAAIAAIGVIAGDLELLGIPLVVSAGNGGTPTTYAALPPADVGHVIPVAGYATCTTCPGGLAVDVRTRRAAGWWDSNGRAIAGRSDTPGTCVLDPATSGPPAVRWVCDNGGGSSGAAAWVTGELTLLRAQYPDRTAWPTASLLGLLQTGTSLTAAAGPPVVPAALPTP